MNRVGLVGGLIAVATIAAAAGAASASARTPTAIGGAPDNTTAAVALDIGGEYSCTGSLWRPNLLVTAAHCVVGDDGSTHSPSQISVWAPGADSTGPASTVKVTDVVVDADWESADSSYEAVGRDVAFLVLDGALGTPYWSRLATEMEAAALTWNSARAEFSGYGITSPSVDPRAELSALPTSLVSNFWPSYMSGIDSFEVAGDGVSGTCGGDSGGPWMGYVAGTRVLVGPLHGGQGAPCSKPKPADETWDDGGVASANTDLTSVALRLAGQQPDVVPTTCIKGPDTPRECWKGRAWEYSFCWNAKKAELWKWNGGDDWNRIERLTGWKDRDECDGTSPYLITFRRIEAKKSQWYSVKIPQQPGNSEAMWDDFKATVS